MLIRLTTMETLSYSAVMDIYLESNQLAASRNYPRMHPRTALWQAEQDFWGYLAEDFFEQPQALLCLWQAQGKLVSALRLQPWQDGLLLTGLETGPEYRGRGYAQALMEAALRGCECPVYAHVRKENTASLAVHQKLGFQIHHQGAVYLDGSRDHGAWTLKRRA